MPRLVLLIALLLAALPGLGQGCTQCRDNAAATPPATQIAYRRAIILLVVTASAVFTGTVVAMRRSR